MTLDRKLGRVGVVGRFRPLHNGSASMLEAVCRQAEHVIIGVGSSNMYNARNPFTAKETKEMIEAYLSGKFDNYEIIEVKQFGHIPEFSDGKRWTQEVLKLYGERDAFITGNDYVRQLLEQHYEVINSTDIVPREKWVKLSGTMVRNEMAKGGNWKSMLPPEVGSYLERNGLAERFRKEFGLYTIAKMADYNVLRRDVEAERLHVMEG